MLKDDFLPSHIQDSFCYLVITSDKFIQIARNSIDPSYFSPKLVVDIIKICYTYYDQFHCAPCSHFHDELVQFLKNKKLTDAEFYVKYIEKIQNMDLPNVDYITSKINCFVQMNEFERAAIEFVKLTEKGEMVEAKELMQKTLRLGIAKEEVGIKYFEEEFPAYLKPDKKESQFVIPMGVDLIDKYMQRGLCRSDFVCILGGAKGGKSWCCIHLGIQGILHGKKVLHITHELSDDETAMRYDQNLGGLSSFLGGKENILIEKVDSEGNTISSEIVEKESVYTEGAVTTARRRAKAFGGELIIRKYPMYSCNMGEIIRYLDYLETFEGFIPDIVINDYVEKMRLPKGEWRRDGINEYYMQSKGIADERKLLMVTVSQVNRQALGKKKLNPKDFAEDIRKLDTVDLVVAISQTEEQEKLKRGRIWVMANRHGPQYFGCMYKYNYDIGQFVQNCWPIKERAKANEEDEQE